MRSCLFFSLALALGLATAAFGFSPGASSTIADATARVVASSLTRADTTASANAVDTTGSTRRAAHAVDFNAINGIYADTASTYDLEVQDSSGKMVNFLKNAAYGSAKAHTSVTVNQDDGSVKLTNSKKIGTGGLGCSWTPGNNPLKLGAKLLASKSVGVLLMSPNVAPKNCSDVLFCSVGDSLANPTTTKNCMLMLLYGLTKGQTPATEDNNKVITYFRNGNSAVKMAPVGGWGTAVTSIEFTNCGAHNTAEMITVPVSDAPANIAGWSAAAKKSIHAPKKVGLMASKITTIAVTGSKTAGGAKVICAGCSTFGASGASTVVPSFLMAVAAALAAGMAGRS